jgi:5-methyltetrahydropteroyltriglutamate--homocysteine methyltransferase
MLDAKYLPAYRVTIPTEPIGRIPRPLRLIEAFSVTDSADPMFEPLYEEAIGDTIAQFEATDSPVIADGEPHKYHNFGTCCVDGLPNLAPGRVQASLR